MSSKVHVFGDSHARFFEVPSFGYRRMQQSRQTMEPVVHAISSASVAGFRPRASTLDTKDRIAKTLPETERLVLAFGQVDLELGYYYRRVIKEDAQSKEAFVAYLLEIYADFIRGLDLGGREIALKGVNLTVLHPKEFTIKYVSKIIKFDDGENQDKKTARLGGAVMPEKEQNRMLLDFNRGLAALAHSEGWRYFDINDAICDRNPLTGTADPILGVASHFRPTNFDHHLSDSMMLRAIHYTGLKMPSISDTPVADCPQTAGKRKFHADA